MNAFDLLPCGYLSFRDDGIITSCNRSLAAWLGYSKNDVTGESIEKLFTLATRIFYNTHFFPLIKLHAKAHEIFLSLKHKNGGEIPVLANAERTVTNGMNIIHCVFMQVQQRKKYEQEILDAKRDAEKALSENKHLHDLTESLEQHAIQLEKQYRSQLAVNENLVQFNKLISHDLQEPIRKIQLFVDLMMLDKDSTLSDRSKTLASKVDTAAKKLKSITASLQRYIVVDSERTHTQVDLNAVISNARASASSNRSFDDFDMVVAPMPLIEGYKNQLELMFFHLIDNAIQFRDPERRLVITIECIIVDENIFRISKERYKYTEHVKISFTDNGTGFSAQYKDYVFELFKKIDGTSPGAGIGLSLVKKIVNNHAGDIAVEAAPGKGATFVIQLPLSIQWFPG
ncbi:MAG TPA: PAS domain-containing sensor histidine kinase [Ohtaekwangia sp.]|nr:PAS domain-containing sensor histidine kinase [Ohtaekwangia sp.]